MKVVITEAALADLVAIGKYIGRDSPRRAERFVTELQAACEDLGGAPLAFPLVRTKTGVALRRRRRGDYLIFYKVTDRVEVVHVLHGARDYLGILDREG